MTGNDLDSCAQKMVKVLETRKGGVLEEVEKAVKVKTVEVTCEGCGSHAVSCPYTGVCS